MKNKQTKTFTYQAGLFLDENVSRVLDAYAGLFSHMQHSLFADYRKGSSLSSLKNGYLIRFQVTARQFNSCKISLEGKISSIKALALEHISRLKEKITALEKKIVKIKNKRIRHEKNRKLHSMKLSLAKLEKEHEKGDVSLCFGSKKLFGAQFHLEENGYSSHEEWKADWVKVRASEFFCIGSSDETAGNQSCVLTVNEEGKGVLKIRLPDALKEAHGKYLLIPDVVFQYGLEEIRKALKEGRALSYRFKKVEDRCKVFISFSQEPVPIITDERLGSIGIDINVDHIALLETDAKGNPIHKERIALTTYGKTKDQAKALSLDVCKKIVSFAKEKKKPLIAEHLDFKKKKASLKETHPKYARMLSSFHYSRFLQGLDARCFREGVGFFQVNPAMTSVIGKLKFAARYGLSKHQAAALCIARRHYRFSEKPTQSIKLVDKSTHVTCLSPERKRGQHVWAFWKAVNKKLVAALAAHLKANRSFCPA
jgi:IS605 OrfB family transposase